MTDNGRAVDWLLAHGEPAVRLLARRDLLGERNLDFGEVLDGAWVRALLAGQRADGGFGVHPYSKWTGAHWRLVSLAELGVPAGDPRVRAALETVLDWLLGEGHRSGIHEVRGLTRRCASQEGNALAVCSRSGAAEDPRVSGLAADLMAWQWPDGGWNCDKRPEAHHSSVNESLAPMWGLHEYWMATGNERAGSSARRAAEFFLEHAVLRSHTTGEVMHPSVMRLRYPSYWHYNLLQALLILTRMGMAGDARAADAVDVLWRKRSADGLWHAEGKWWSEVGATRYPEVVDWGSKGPNAMLTLHAMTVLAPRADSHSVISAM